MNSGEEYDQMRYQSATEWLQQNILWLGVVAVIATVVTYLTNPDLIVVNAPGAVVGFMIFDRLMARARTGSWRGIAPGDGYDG